MTAPPEKTGKPGTTTRPRTGDTRPDSAGAAARKPAEPAKEDNVPAPALDDASRNPADIWDEWFTQHEPSQKALSRLLIRMHDEERHEHVIACVEAAIIQGKARPWMYEVLALSMELAHRPKADVERVLLSRIDFTAADVPSMLYSAAYLTRFGGERQALRMYRQAAQLEPTRPEAYVLGLKLARKLKDFDAVLWAAPGMLTNVWTANHVELHRQAENAADDTRKELEQTGRTAEAEQLDAALADARKRDLTLRLVWAGDGDLNLIVEEPPGTVCSFENPFSRGGGVLTHDGYGPLPRNCYEEYICASGVPGVYRARIHHAGGNIVGKRAQLTIVQYKGTPRELSRTVPITLEEQDRVIRIPLEQGRRTELAAEARNRVSQIELRPQGRRSLTQMVGGLDREQRTAGERFMASRTRGPNGLPGQSPDVGYQPVITVLSEGVTMSAQAVISGDRRYVRITTVPSFTSITDVFTFTFQGGPASNGSQSNPTGTPSGNVP